MKTALGLVKPNKRILSNLVSTRFAFLATITAATLSAGAAIPVPPPEKLLPDDTLVVITAPDIGKIRELYKNSPQTQLWNDPSLKTFKDKFLAKWKDEFVDPLERELNIRLDDYLSLPKGQVTFVITKNDWLTKEDEEPGMLLLIDTKEKGSQLKTNLTNLRKNWVESGKALKTEKIRDYEFSVLSISSNDMPKTLRKFFPSSPETQELGEDGNVKKTPPSKSELVVGSAESLLILGNSLKSAEKIVARLTGGSIPALADLAAYQENHNALFRDAPVYGWVNIKAFVEAFTRKASEKKDDAAPDPLAGIDPGKVMAATGIGGVKTLAFNVQSTGEGSTFQLFLGVPEANRQGIFKILAGEPKEYTPPPFVPADAVKFQRWRIDGKKSWATLEKLLQDISPQAINGVNFLIDTANANAKEKDPDFDLRKSLIGNLGDDMISYEKAPRGSAVADLQNPPSLFLLGSPHPDELVAALRSILVFLSAQAGSPAEREFLNRKIYSVPVPQLPMFGGSPKGSPRTLNYAASGSYVAFSTDASILEEYLRSSDSQAKALRETPGLLEAAQKVTSSGTSLFGFENQVETMRVALELLKKGANSDENPSTLNVLPGASAVSGFQKDFKQWVDFSLLPPYEKLAKYFHFSVYAGSATVDGLTVKVYAPVPPALKGEKAK